MKGRFVDIKHFVCDEIVFSLKHIFFIQKEVSWIA